MIKYINFLSKNENDLNSWTIKEDWCVFKNNNVEQIFDKV